MNKSKIGLTLRPKIYQGKKPVLEKCLNLSKTDKELNAEQMKEALNKIAQEVHKFRSGDTSDELPEELGLYKSKLNMKRKQIKSLKENLNTACIVAKTLTSSKEKECVSLNKHLHEVRNETVNLEKKNAENAEIIQRLNMENNVLTTKFQNLRNFIELGYKELQKLRTEQVKDLSIELQLKEIVICCGQYYADYQNERENVQQFDQRNRFLTNKLSIMERDLESAREELKKFQRAPKCEKKTKNNKNEKNLTIGYVRSESKLGQVNYKVALDSVGSTHSGLIESVAKDQSLDLSSHMSLVKSLLSNQDTMLKDLKSLTEELSCLNS